MKLLIAPLFLFSCGLLPSFPGLAEPSAAQNVTAPIASVAQLVEPESLWRFAWLSVLLVLFFPKVREPLVGVWTALFKAAAIPFLLLREWHDSKFGAK